MTHSRIVNSDQTVTGHQLEFGGTSNRYYVCLTYNKEPNSHWFSFYVRLGKWYRDLGIEVTIQ